MSVMNTGNTKRPSDGGSAAAGEMQEGRDVDGRVVVIVSELRSGSAPPTAAAAASALAASHQFIVS